MLMPPPLAPKSPCPGWLFQTRSVELCSSAPLSESSLCETDSQAGGWAVPVRGSQAPGCLYLLLFYTRSPLRGR